MLKIGEFARLAQVTVKTLHHYDNLGLLHPARIDPSSNYRLYTIDQLPRLHRILALKELGLSLEQIGAMIDEQIATEEMRRMLRRQQAEAQRALREQQRRLAMIEFRLRMLEAEEHFPPLDVVVKSVEPMSYLSLFLKTDKKLEQGPHSMLAFSQALKEAIADGRVRHTGDTIDVFHGETIIPLDSPELGDRQHEVRLGVLPGQQPVTLDGIGTLEVREVPASQTAATLMLIKDKSMLGHFEKAALLRRWSVAHGYHPQDHTLFFHHRGPLQTLNPDEFIIEAQLVVSAPH